MKNKKNLNYDGYQEWIEKPKEQKILVFIIKILAAIFCHPLRGWNKKEK